MSKILLSKKFFAAILIMTLITSGFAFAMESKESGDEILKLSLEDGVKLAEENNQQIKLSKLGLEKAELGRQQIKYQDKKVKNQEDELGTSIMTGTFEYDYQIEIGEKQADVGIDLAKAGIDAAVKGIQFGVEAAYYGALSARDNTAIAEAALERQKDMLKIAEAKYKAGVVAKKDVLDAEVQLAKSEGDLLKAQSEEEKAYINLKKLLGLPLDRDIELTDSFEYKPVDLDKTLEKVLEEAQKQRIDIMSAEGAFEIAQLDFDLTSKVYPSNTFLYKEKEYAMEEARIKLTDTKASVEAEVRGIWLDFEEAKTNIPVLDKSLEMAEESLRLAKLSYEAGLVRNVDVAAAEEGLKQVQLQRSGVIYNYNLAQLKLENAVYFAVSGGAAPSGN